MSVDTAQTDTSANSNEVRCKRCSALTRLAHKILNARTGGTLRMYKCQCGEQTWGEFPH